MNDKALEKEIRNLKENADAIYAEQSAERKRFMDAHPDVVEQTRLALDLAFQMQKARRHARLSQAELAKRLRTTQSALSRLEKGGNVKLETLQRYAQVCGRRLVVKMV